MRTYLTIVLVLVFALAGLFGGCAKPRGELFVPLREPLVWPEPPDAPRVQYVGSISTELDLKREVSWTQSLGELFFGKGKFGVLLCPYGVAFENNRLYVADAGTGSLHIFDFVTREYKQITAAGDTERLLKPVGLTVGDHKIYVADSTLHQVCMFDNDGKYISSFGQDVLKRPSGIAYSKRQRKVYVADTWNHLICVFDSNGTLLGSIGSRGYDPGQFNFPTQLWVDNNDQLYVSDTLNYRIQIFSGNGTFIKSFGQQGDRPGYFAHPTGVAVDIMGNSYITDRRFENIQIFDSNSQILMAVGSEGSGNGQFWLPAGIYIDEKNRIYVADSFNKRIQIFDLLEEKSNENSNK
jgi:DNA-binding beta-propeller fold protein YncE